MDDIKDIKKVLLINPSVEGVKGILRSTLYPPVGLASLATIMQKYGVMCSIYDASLFQNDVNEVVDIIRKGDYDAVGISASIANFTYACSIGRQARALGFYVFMGGPYVSCEPIQSLEKSDADFVIFGEAEMTMDELLQKKWCYEGIKGLAYRNNGKVIKNPPRPFIENLDEIPLPAYELISHIRNYPNLSTRPAICIITSRGCPYQCTFCNKSVFGKKFRAKSPTYVVKEIEYLVKNIGVKSIDILDDNFTFDIKRAKEICELIIKKKIKVELNFPNGVRADRLDDELIEKLRKAGGCRIGVGVESGNQKVLNDIKKGLVLQQAKWAIQTLRRNGFRVSGFFMLGLPTDNENTMQQTIDFAKECNPHLANFSIALPLPGTEMYEQFMEQDFISPDADLVTGYYATTQIYQNRVLSNKTIAKYFRKAYLSFYLRPQKIWDIVVLAFSSVHSFRWVFDTGVMILLGFRMKKRTKKRIFKNSKIQKLKNKRNKEMR